MAFAATMILATSCDKEPVNEPVPDNTVNFTATIFTGGHFISGGVNRYMVVLSDEEYLHNYMFNLYNQLGEIDDNGNVTIPSGTYTCSENIEDYTISPVAMYIDNSEGKSVDLTELTVVVTDNQIVLTTVIEGVTHIATYNGTPSMPATLPEPDVDFEATYAYAYYTDNTIDENTAKFKLFLSDLGHDEDGNVLPNGTYYELVLTLNKLDPNAEIAIPAGRYELDDTDSTTGYISSVTYKKLGESTSETVDRDIILSGSLIVNEDGSLEGSFKMSFSGATHNVTFSGNVEILENTIPAETPYSTLTSDIECDLSNHDLIIWYEEDPYGVGYNVYSVNITTNDSVGDNLCFEILRGTDKDTNLSGKYTLSNSKKEFTVIPGYIDGFTLMASWYYYASNAMNIPEIAPIVDGWIEIETQDNQFFTITFNVYDDLNNNITGTWSDVMPAKASREPRPVINL